MKLLPLFFFFLFILLTNAQRRTTAKPSTDPETPKPVSRGRGRSRFTSSPEYTQIAESSSIESTYRKSIAPRRRVIENVDSKTQSRATTLQAVHKNIERRPTPTSETADKVFLNSTVDKKVLNSHEHLGRKTVERKNFRSLNKRPKNTYEVEETINDDTDPYRRVKKTRVITETNFRAINYPKRTSNNIDSSNTSPKISKNLITPEPTLPSLNSIGNSNLVEDQPLDTTLKSEIDTSIDTLTESEPKEEIPKTLPVSSTAKPTEAPTVKGNRRTGLRRVTNKITEQTTLAPSAIRVRGRNRPTQAPNFYFQAVSTSVPSSGFRRRVDSLFSSIEPRKGPSVFNAEANTAETRARTGRKIETPPEKITLDIPSRSRRVNTTPKILPSSTTFSSRRGRFRTRKMPVIDEQKLEVLPLFEEEPKLVSSRGSRKNDYNSKTNTANNLKTVKSRENEGLISRSRLINGVDEDLQINKVVFREKQATKKENIDLKSRSVQNKKENLNYRLKESSSNYNKDNIDLKFTTKASTVNRKVDTIDSESRKPAAEYKQENLNLQSTSNHHTDLKPNRSRGPAGEYKQENLNLQSTSNRQTDLKPNRSRGPAGEYKQENLNLQSTSNYQTNLKPNRSRGPIVGQSAEDKKLFDINPRSRQSADYQTENIDKKSRSKLPFSDKKKEIIDFKSRSRGPPAEFIETSATETDIRITKPSDRSSRVAVNVSVETKTEPPKSSLFNPKTKVKESVTSEINEVTSRRKVLRKKVKVLDETKPKTIPTFRGSKKSEVKLPKAQNSEEIGDSDNYPEAFKALIKAKKEQTESRVFLSSTSSTISPAINIVTASTPSSSTYQMNIKEINDNENELKPKTTTPSSTSPRWTRSRQTASTSTQSTLDTSSNKRQSFKLTTSVTPPPRKYQRTPSPRRTSSAPKLGKGITFKPRNLTNENDVRKSARGGNTKHSIHFSTKVPKLSTTAKKVIDRGKYRGSYTTIAPKYIPTIPSLLYVPTVPMVTSPRNKAKSWYENPTLVSQ